VAERLLTDKMDAGKCEKWIPLKNSSLSFWLAAPAF
jgi:hypothetical protein